MRVGVDQAGEDDCVLECQRGNIGPRNFRIRAKGLDPAVLTDQNSSVLDRWTLDRQYPTGCQPSGPHLSGAGWEPVRSLP